MNLRDYELAARAVNHYEAIVEDGLHIALRDGAIERLPIEKPAPDAANRSDRLRFQPGPVRPHQPAGRRSHRDRRPGSHQSGRVGRGRRPARRRIGARRTPTRRQLESAQHDRRDPPRAERVLVQTERWRRNSDIARLLLVFPYFTGRTRGYELVTLQLLPTDREWLEWLAIRRWPSRVLPTYLNIPWDQLIADLIRQALFVRLHRSFAQTMASVSASRLAAMDTAQRSIEERLSELEVRHHHLRQSEITKELLDVVSGFEVLQQTPDGR